MREAKYARLQAASGSRAGAVAKRPPVAPAATAEPAPDARADEAPAAGTCGHKSMNGRACTREQGHPQKSHRYS